MSKQDEQRLLVKIATLYYSENKKQSEIASLLHLSQSFVSRALTRCQKEGLVKITVVQPTNIFVDLEKAIEERFGIRQAIVVDVGENASYSQVKHAIGSAAAHYVETRLRPEDLVGISSWSSTIRCMVDEMHPQNIRAAGVIQLLGGVGPNGNVQATILTQQLAAHLGCPAWLLPSQSIEHSVEERSRLVNSPDVAAVVAKFAEVDVAAVAALPDILVTALKDHTLLQVLQKGQVALLMLLLDLADAVKQESQLLKALLAGGFGHLLIHLGPLFVLTRRRSLQVGSGIADAAQLLEPQLGMLLLIAGGLLKDGRDLLEALFLGLAGKISILIAGHALSRKRLPQIGLRLASLQLHNAQPSFLN